MKPKLYTQTLIAIVTLGMLLANPSLAQSGKAGSRIEDKDELKLAAIEALMAAPEEKAMPALLRVMASNNSVEIKSRALFVLSQIDEPEARQALLDTARNTTGNTGGELQYEAIRNVGINGDEELLQELAPIYASGDADVREAVLDAYLIADDDEAIYEVAAAATSEEEFEAAVNMLGAMGAIEQIDRLRDHPDAGHSMVQAYAVAGDTDRLIDLAKDSSNPERQKEAITGLGIAGDDKANAALLELYRSNSDPEIRDAVRQGFLISDDDESVVELFKLATDDQEKAELLRLLVLMDSDAAMDAIDAALQDDPQ
jgi:HEAT repeat protein